MERGGRRADARQGPLREGARGGPARRAGPSRGPLGQGPAGRPARRSGRPGGTAAGGSPATSSSARSAAWAAWPPAPRWRPAARAGPPRSSRLAPTSTSCRSAATWAPAWRSWRPGTPTRSSWPPPACAGWASTPRAPCPCRWTSPPRRPGRACWPSRGATTTPRWRGPSAALDDPAAHACLRAERALLTALGGGCQQPVGGFCEPVRGGLRLTAFAQSEDGTRSGRVRARGPAGRPRGPRRRRGRRAGGDPRVSGFVHLVGAGPGDPGLLTVAGRRALEAAEVVVHDRLGTAELLPLCRADAELIDAGKAPGRAALTQDEINAALVEHGLAGRRVVRLKGGDPFVFGRGGEEAEALARSGRALRGRARHHQRDLRARVRRDTGHPPRPVRPRSRSSRATRTPASPPSRPTGRRSPASRGPW